MLWSSRKILKTGKDLRCPILISLKTGEPWYECNRPARYYAQIVSKQVNGKSCVWDLGLARLCKGHKKVCEAQGITLTVVDRRRAPEPKETK